MRTDDIQVREAPNHEASNHGVSRREVSERGSGPRVGPRAATRWLVVRDGAGGPEPLCLDGGNERVLPVFSFGEEAEIFLRLGGLGGRDGDGWRVMGTSVGDLVSVLRGPCADVGRVALDPLPGMLGDGTVGLVEVGRERFLKDIVGRR